MPNWTRNTISAPSIKTLKIYTDNNVDFNKIIPEPSVEEECLPEYRYDESDKIIQLENKPWFSWYKWRNNFWGTKWNACDTNISDTENKIEFDTAWKPSLPIYQKISEMLGEEEMTAEFINLDDVYSDIIRTVWINGHMIRAYISRIDFESFEYSSFEEIDVNEDYA